MHTDDGFTVHIDKAVQDNGRPTVSFSSKEISATGFASIYQLFDASAYKGKRVRLSGDVKTDGVDDWDGLFVQIDGQKEVLAFDAMEDRPIKGTADWKNYSCVVDVPSNADEIKIGFLHSHLGHAWIGNLAFDIVGTNFSLTAAKPKSTKLPAPRVNEHPHLEFQ